MHLQIWMLCDVQNCRLNIFPYRCACNYLSYPFRLPWILLKKLGCLKKMLSNIEEVPVKKRYWHFSHQGICMTSFWQEQFTSPLTAILILALTSSILQQKHHQTIISKLKCIGALWFSNIKGQFGIAVGNRVLNCRAFINRVWLKSFTIKKLFIVR